MAYTDIDKPSDYFNTKLYTGNGSSGHSITGVGFAPNFVWIKKRDGTPNHFLFDTVRGVQKALNSNQNYAESTQSNALTAFGSDGFTVGSDGDVNSGSMVSWNWKESADAGFDIISYTGNGSSGRTISHNLSAVPSMIITKDRGNTEHWGSYHKSLPAGYNIYLNLTNAQDDNNSLYTTTAPTSSVYSVGNNNRTNGNGRNYISYVFAEKKGYSKFGSYKGNGNANGTFVYTGFKPAFVMIKSMNATKDWKMIDNKRNPSGEGGANPVRYRLAANTNASTSDDGDGQDFTSQGFKFRTTDSHMNGNGTQYLYMAFSEEPFVTSTGVPATAR